MLQRILLLRCGTQFADLHVGHGDTPRASVVLETKVVGRVEGLQLCGKAARADEAARRAYLRRFPYAALAELTLWAIAPDFMKFTDNTLGFGKKLIWNNR